MKKILVLILLGVITILTPLSFKANYYSIDQPVIDLNNHTLNEVFTDTINKLDQYKITSILDLKIYEGLSLRDIFESGNLILSSVITLSSGVTRDNINFDLYRNSTNADIGFRFDYMFESGNSFYVSYYRYGYTKTDFTFSVFDYNTYSNEVIYNTLTTLQGNKEEQKSSIITINKNGCRFYPRTYTNDIDVSLNNYVILDMSIFTTAPSQAQLDDWLSFYLDPSTIASFDMVGDIQVYKVGDTLYNLNEMINDKVYSTFNLDTFDNLTEGEITDQFGAWQTLGIEDIEVLSLTEFQTFAPALDQEDMLYWYNYYNLILEYDEVQAGILSDLEITILIIALVLFIIGIALAIYFHHKIMFFVTGLLWFVPIVIVPNIFIITFSVIMIIIFGLLAFYNSQGKDFD